MSSRNGSQPGVTRRSASQKSFDEFLLPTLEEGVEIDSNSGSPAGRSTTLSPPCARIPLPLVSNTVENGDHNGIPTGPSNTIPRVASNASNHTSDSHDFNNSNSSNGSRSRTYRERQSSSISAAGILQSTSGSGARKMPSRTRVRHNIEAPSTSNTNTASPSRNMGLSAIFRERSIGIRETIARGRSSIASRYSSMSSSAGSSARQPNDSPVNSGIATTRQRSASIIRSRNFYGQVYRGYKLDDYALIELMEARRGSSGSLRAESGKGGNLKGEITWFDASQRDPNSFRGYLVNKFGYPEGKGSTPTEKRGPYVFLLCKVQQVHYEENQPFWTVERLDTKKSMRGDAVDMEPIQSEQGLYAAQAATILRTKHLSGERSIDDDGEYLDFEDHQGVIAEKKNRLINCFATCFCVSFCLPWFCLYECCLVIRHSKGFALMLKQATMFLNGIAPYRIACRITPVNILVLCSFWYLFIDQIRLCFLPITWDQNLAIINFVVWIVLSLELIFQAFIRPDGWKQLVRSDQAMSPKTARFISTFHLIVEIISLIFFAPVFFCIFTNQGERACSSRPIFSFMEASIDSVLGPTIGRAVYGRFYYGIVRFRVFSLVRHWRNAWLNYTFINQRKYKIKRKMRKGRPRYIGDDRSQCTVETAQDDTERDDTSVHSVSYGAEEYSDLQLSAKHEEREREQKRAKASNIGTALMIVNSHRALFMFCALTAAFPLLFLVNESKVVNGAASEMVDFLQEINLQSNKTGDCNYLFESVRAWSKTMAPRFDMSKSGNELLISFSIRSALCYEEFSEEFSDKFNPVMTYVEDCPISGWPKEQCITFDAPGVTRNGTVLSFKNTRVGSIVTYSSQLDSEFGVSASYNFTQSIRLGARNSFFLQFLLLIFVWRYLQVLRNDAVHLVLGSLRSMLRIVARYAKNPLAPTLALDTSTAGDTGSVGSDGDDGEDQLVSTYETEQLVTAVSKIADLLRKCWGVAGADIISTNLASRNGDFEVFNPTVPGRNVFALFAFAKIKDFDHALKKLEGDVLILINDVAAVLHGDVYRWALGDSGQCNKNLGAAFVIVFKIGLVKEVIAKLEEATRVVFSTAGTKKSSLIKGTTGHVGRKGLKLDLGTQKDAAMVDAAMHMSLKKIPGISTFTDRAVIAMLKAFAGIHRDTTLRAWTRDFRLNVNPGSNWSVDMIFGMDAGWAVEGAVGSEYKIDATYLSPHVNMASRMMSACNHYGVTILLSEAVQELLSDQGKQKMRNIDRVTVKGSSQVQNIFTYDARSAGADFFIHCVSDEQADHQAMNYEPNIWNIDQDLKAMRHHITEDFEAEFKAGMKNYYSGNWPVAIEKFERANEIMIETAMDEGYLEESEDCDSAARNELYSNESADQPCQYLINFMKSRGGQAPEDWDGWHPLLSK